MFEIPQHCYEVYYGNYLIWLSLYGVSAVTDRYQTDVIYLYMRGFRC